jgi:hypothetical protein
MRVYLDASFVVALLVDEPLSSRARSVWTRVRSAVACRTVYPEVRAGLALAQRMGRLSNAQLGQTRDKLEGLLLELHILELSDALSRLAGELAEREGLRAYDAVHLASALSIADPELLFATFDRDLAAAARRNGLAVAVAG